MLFILTFSRTEFKHSASSESVISKLTAMSMSRCTRCKYSSGDE